MPDITLPPSNFERQDNQTPPARLINWYAEQAPEDPSRAVNYIPRPGHDAFATLSGGTVPQGLFYQPGVAGGHVYAVASGNVYQVTNAGVVTTLGTINSTTEAVRFAATITQLFLLVGSSVYEITDSAVTLQTIAALTGEVLVDIAGINGRIVFLAADGDFYWSEILDGDNVLGLNLANAEANADGGVALVVDKQELWLLGERTIEPQVDTGQAAEFTFARVTGALIDRGCTSRHTVLREDNTIFWLGEDGVFYRANGYTPQRISTSGEEERFQTEIQDGNGSSIRAWFYTNNGHKFIGVRTPNQGCHVYDLATERWHEQKTTGSTTYAPFQIVMGPSNKPFALEAGFLRQLNPSTYTDAGTAITREGTPYLPARRAAPMFNFALDVADPTASFTLETSDDDGTTHKSRGSQTAPHKWRSLGRVTAPGRSLRITTTSSVDTTLRGARYNDREL